MIEIKTTNKPANLSMLTMMISLRGSFGIGWQSEQPTAIRNQESGTIETLSYSARSNNAAKLPIHLAAGGCDRTTPFTLTKRVNH